MNQETKCLPNFLQRYRSLYLVQNVRGPETGALVDQRSKIGTQLDIEKVVA